MFGLSGRHQRCSREMVLAPRNAHPQEGIVVRMFESGDVIKVPQNETPEGLD